MVNQRSTILQIVNIISLVNFFTIIVMKDSLADSIVKFSLIFCVSLFLISFFLIMFFYNSFLEKIEDGFERQSSNLSPILKYVLPNFMASFVIVLFIVGLVYDIEMFKVFFLFLVIIIFPFIIYFKSLFVAMRGNEIRFYNYSDKFIQINGSQLKSIGKVLFGFIYKVKYVDENNSSQAKYFFPKGYLLSQFIEPDSVKLLKSLIVKSDSD